MILSCWLLQSLHFSILSLLIAGGAIPDSKYKPSPVVDFRHPVTDRYVLLNSGSGLLAWADLAQTGAAYSAIE